jgi:hypothetical protein
MKGPSDQKMESSASNSKAANITLALCDEALTLAGVCEREYCGLT